VWRIRLGCGRGELERQPAALVLAGVETLPQIANRFSLFGDGALPLSQ
jgi:hypothetical protein